MTQAERLVFLIQYLQSEQPKYRNIPIPEDISQQKSVLRTLMNIRPPKAISSDVRKVQNAYLSEEIKQKGITDFKELLPVRDGIYLWQGDITTLRCDAIVNAANAEMLGCFCPCHGCIDNAIHTYAGVELRLKCAEIMKKQGFAEPVGRAKITKAYNLPCRYVIHTVGPMIYDNVTKRDEELLASCYRSCLEIAKQNNIQSIAFCCISTGEYHFPNRRGAEIAIRTVTDYRKQTNSKIEVIFNVFKDMDYEIYRELLG